MKQYSIFYLFLLLMLPACNNKLADDIKFTQAEIENLTLNSTRRFEVEEDSVVKLDMNRFLHENILSANSLIKEMKFLPLETLDESLIAEIEKISTTDSNIYIIDNYKGGSILCFTKSGHFLKRIHSGPAPEELMRINDIAFDKESNELIVFHTPFFSFFTPDGQFIRRVKLPLNARNFTSIPDGYLFYAAHKNANGHLGQYKKDQIFVTNKNFELISCGLPYQLAENNTFEGDSYLHEYNSTICYTPKFTNTIYQYRNPFLFKTKYLLDISDKEIPLSLLQGDYEQMWESLKQNDYFYYMGDFVENENHEYFSINNNYNKKCFRTFIFRDKNSGNMLGGTQIKLDNYFAFNRPLTSDKNYFVSYIDYHQMSSDFKNTDGYKKMSNENKSILDALNDDDNPILIFYKLKSL